MNGIDELTPFQRRSWLSLPLRAVLRPIVLWRGGRRDRAAFRQQYPEAARNVEIALEGLLKIAASHPIRVAPILQTVAHYLRTYFGAQGSTRREKQYLIYTSEDARIPFRPEWDTFYVYMLSQISTLTHEVVGMSSFGQVRRVARTFQRLNSEGARVFHALPTRMPRLTQHTRLSLRAVQYLDAPLNCCPSLHIAYTVMIDNLFAWVLETERLRPAVWADVRTATLGMINSVLYTKQHSLVDVAFGILLARIVFTSSYPEHPFHDLTAQFDALQEENRDIPYGTIRSLLSRASELFAQEEDLARCARRLFQEQGYPYLEASEADPFYQRLGAGP